MGKDSQGINRGKCFEPGCDCDDFVIHKKGTKCNNCGHVPTIHVKMRFETVNPPGGSLESGSKDDEEIEKSCKDASEDPNDDLAVRIRSISVDSQGISRGECTITGCKCKQFSYIAQQRGIRCSWCGHPPTKHVASVPKLDTKRREGDEYEKDSRHTKLFTSRYGQLQNSKKSPELSSPLPVSDIEEDQIDSQFHTQQQEQTYAHVPTNAVSNVPPPQNVPQPSVWQQKICKLDGCSRPVRMEHNGKVHDFCCITHADEFNCKLVTGEQVVV